MGVRHANGSRGDLIAVVQVMLPEGADAETVERLLDAARAADAAGAGPRYLYRLMHQRLLLPRVTSGEARRRNVTLVGLHAIQAQMWRD